MKIYKHRCSSGYVITLFISDNWYIYHTKNCSDLSPIKDYIKGLEDTQLTTTKWWRIKNKRLIEKAYNILQDVEKNGPNGYVRHHSFNDEVSYEVLGL